MSGRLHSEQAHPFAACCELRSCVDSALTFPLPTPQATSTLCPDFGDPSPGYSRPPCVQVSLLSL